MIEVNYVAVILAAIASMAVGFVWYGPLFGKQWMKEKGFTKENMEKAKKEMGKWYALTAILAIISAYVLAHVMALSKKFYGYPMLQTGLTSAFWMWLGFVMPVQTTASIFGGRNWKLLGIDTGHNLASLLVMGVVIGLLG